jgi:MFS family permease
MPDLTPKPLRTNANAVINFVGYLGAVLGSGLTIFFAFSAGDPMNIKTIIPFFITSVVLMIVIFVFLTKFFERRAVAEMQPELAIGEKLSQTLAPVRPDMPLSRRDKINFGIIIAGVFLCWFAFNALQNFGSLYAERILHAEKKWGLCTIALAVASLFAFLPSIWIAKIIGRKWSVILGLLIVLSALTAASVLVKEFDYLIVALFAFCGAGWAIIMVNAYPMFCEHASAKNVGRITGVYYFVSQGAQFLTSNISGYVYKWVGLQFYYNYAIIFMSLALLVCVFFRTKRGEKCT